MGLRYLITRDELVGTLSSDLIAAYFAVVQVHPITGPQRIPEQKLAVAVRFVNGPFSQFRLSMIRPLTMMVSRRRLDAAGSLRVMRQQQQDAADSFAP